MIAGSAAETESPRQLEPDQVLPALRNDLQLQRGPRNLHGEPTWTIRDPVRNRFLQVSERDFHLLNAWERRSAEAVVQGAAANAGYDFSLDELSSLVDFLSAEELLDASNSRMRERLATVSAARQQSLLKLVMHKYLFFRIPLVRPDAFLDKLYPHTRVFFQSWFVIVSLLVGVVGLALIVKNWASFVHSFSYLFSFSGAVVFAITLFCVKVLHELGHALMCKHHGLRVPTMGVAFIVMWPVLYTDATDSWRLRSRRKRASIAAAGVSVELLLACYAMVAWVLLPDGLARSAAQVVATTAWITSVLVNLNPLMRFDGYYFLSDLLNVPNLQDRSIAIAKWRLRRWLFRADQPFPDDVPERLVGWLTFYAWALLIYRFFLFLGIALLVYHLFFKALGIILFIVEIWWFILRPVANEIKEWPLFFQQTSVGRRRLLVGALAAILVVLAFPWKSRIEGPALLVVAQQYQVYPVQPARIERLAVVDGEWVEQGTTLISMSSPVQERAREQATHELQRLQALAAQIDTSEQMVSQRLVVIQQLERARSELEAIERDMAKLDFSAPIAGEVRDLTPDLHPGRWVNQELRLMSLVDASSQRVLAWVGESDVALLDEQAPARFYAEHPDGPQGLNVTISRVHRAAVSELELPDQASTFGGAIAVADTASPGAPLRPVSAQFQLEGVVDAEEQGVSEANPRLRGVLVMEGERQSPLWRGLQWFMAALLRETGF